MSLVFFGTEEESRLALQVLIEAGYEFEAVVTKPDRVKGRGLRVEAPAIKTYVENLNSTSSSGLTGGSNQSIKVLQPESLKDFVISATSDRRQDRFAVLVSYGKIIPQSLIDQFEAIINIHPSMLPDLRGPSPVQTAIIRGDKDFAISIMQLEAGMDSGPIYKQFPVGLHGVSEYRDTLNTLVEVGTRELAKILPDIMSGKIVPIPQDETKATYCQMISKADAELDFTQPARKVAAQINALSEWPKCKITLHNVENVALLTAAAVSTPYPIPPHETVIGQDGTMLIGCGEGAIALDLIQPPGGRPMSSKDFWNGIKSKGCLSSQPGHSCCRY